ncbi:hypothetical protein M1O16_03905 [Dehalococcoidia bacterium]|nr:hypothetical protein [Dehalococcoidia bacterium]
MDERVRKAVDDFIQEILKRHPGVQPELMDGHLSTEDAWIRIEAASEEESEAILDTVVKLDYDFYFDRGVDIMATVPVRQPV